MSQGKDYKSVAASRKQAAELQLSSFIKTHGGINLDALKIEGKDMTQVSLVDVLNAKDLAITELNNVGATLEKLRSGEWKVRDVTMAYCRRSLVAHKLTNCLTETFYDQALKRAEQLDEEFSKGGPKGPLFGLPISLKDQVDVEGVECNMGYVGWVGTVSKKNAVLVDILLKAGAVLYVKTNIPQSLMSPQTNNAVYGRTSNPRNVDLSCGGSSGGEGALIALKGSPLGVGSDIGGSVRIPSGFNALYGLRGSYNRVPYQGATNSMIGFEAVPSILGPLSSSIDGLKTFLKAVLEGEPWNADPFVAYRPWNEDLYQLKNFGGGKQLCFGLWRDDGMVRPAPPYTRALDMTKKALEDAGHKVVEYSFEETKEGVEILIDLYVADGEKDIDAACALSGEPRFFGRLIPGDAKELSVSEYWALCAKRKDNLKRQLDALEKTVGITGTGRPLDGIIAPVSSHLPELHGRDMWVWYTGLGNLHDFPSGVFPVTRVDPKVDAKVDLGHEPRTSFEKQIYEDYDPETYKAAPVSLQIMGRKGQEEAVIKMTEIIDAALKKSALGKL